VGRIVKEYGFKVISGSEEFFAEKPDMVLCGAVNSEKIDIIELCAEKGVNIMLDKPLVTSPADYRRLAAAASSGRIKIGMMLTERFNPPVYTLKKLISSGAVGSPVSFLFDKPHKLTPASREPWHFDRARNGRPRRRSDDTRFRSHALVHRLRGQKQRGLHPPRGPEGLRKFL
jgi:predicted dehydrogenase